MGIMAGEAVGELHGAPAGFFVQHFALDDEGLADAGEVKVVVEGGRGPDCAALQSAMREGMLLAEVRFVALLEGEPQIGQELGLPLSWPTTLMIWVCCPASSMALHRVLASMASASSSAP